MAGPRLEKFGELEFSPRFEHGDMAQIAQVVSGEDLSELGTGFARMTNAKIPWTVKYDELILVIEGEFSVETERETFVAGPKDSIWLPNGTQLIYHAENALVFYAIHPVNWADEQ